VTAKEVGYRIGRYKRSLRDEWDSFVTTSKNGTFLFLRSYMDYHADRFADYSLIVRDRAGILALLPANKAGDDVHSHQGLTYGGLVTCGRMTTPVMMEVFDTVQAYLREAGVKALHYKCIPWIYHRLPAEEDRYVLFRAGAEIIRRDVLSVVSHVGEQAPVQTRRRRGSAKANRSAIVIAQSNDWRSFWQLLSAHVEARFGVVPVHTVDEIERLQRSFPESIKLFVGTRGEEILAGTVIYESRMVAHVQYIATSDAGRQEGALDKLFLELLDGYYRDKPFFDFGTSNASDRQGLNTGLIEQKEGFGARAVVHDFYRVAL